MTAAANDRLKQLYPFLHGGRQDADVQREALALSVREKVAHHQDVVARFFAEHGGALVDAAHTIAGVYRGGGRLFTMGNGGSSCDAAHVAVEFQHPVTAGRPALTAIDLTADRTMMTAVGNDVGFAHVYVRQLIALARSGDGLIGLSTSGNSENLTRAFEKAQQMGLKTIALAGGSGGRMAGLGLDHCLVVGTDSIHRVQECHVAIYHILWDLVHTILADDRQGVAAPAEEDEHALR
ncbi:MAG TPA: SIS domain-containing protein [Dongiaceae bacterium]|nr:SIS domain-containing protein [Dongiaceae bacterium]